MSALDDAAGGAHGRHRAPRAPRGLTLRRLGDWLRPDRRRILLLVVIVLAVGGGSALTPILVGEATNIIFRGAIGLQYEPGESREEIIAELEADGQDRIADLIRSTGFVPGEGVDFGALALVIAPLAAATLLFAFLNWLAGGLRWWILIDGMVRLRTKIATKIHRLTLAAVDATPRGDLLSRMVNDVDNVGNSFFMADVVFLSSASIVAMSFVMVLLSPTLTLVVLASTPVVVVITLLVGRRSSRLYERRWEQTGRLTAHIEEAYAGHALVAVFGRSREVGERFDAINAEVFRSGYRADALAGGIAPVVGFVGNLVYVAAAVIGAILVTGASVSLGAVQGFILAATFFLQSVAHLAGILPALQSGLASFGRVFGILELPDDPADPAPGGPAPSGPGRVAFDRVSFRYQEDVPLIEELSFVAEPGHTVAIVGPTGAGKSTLVNLLLRFYEPGRGRILLDGTDIASLGRGELRSRIGMVLQDTWLFQGTIRDNIAYGRPDATEAEILAAAREAHVEHMIRSLPDGFDTVLDEDDERLSAGEKQLITIARAFLARPTLLVLDEATSSVDTRTELQIQRAMAELRRSRTCFVIAHRLSTIRDADRILVMEGGAIVEQGRHEELVAAQGAYARLYQAQFSAPPADG